MTNTTRTQLRGNCQCCGRQQAVNKERVAKHGYTVEQGYFQGVCSGHQYAPLQQERTHADAIIKMVRADAARLNAEADKFESGKLRLKEVDIGTYRHPELVPFEDAPTYKQEDATRHHVFQLRNRARAGLSFADGLERIADAVHGQPLVEVKVEAKADPVAIGERRKSQKDGVLTATQIVGARVHWKNERGLKSWTGTAAWRKLEKV